MSSPKPKKSKAVAPLPIWRKWADEFWRGFTDLSVLSLAICALFFGICLIASAYLYSPKAMVKSWGDYIPRSSLDATAFATVDALRLGATETDNPRLLILGSSTLAQAFGSAQTLLSELEVETHQDWDVHLLTTPLQSPLDQLTLLEAALSGQKVSDPLVIVVIGTGVARITWTRDRQTQYADQQRIGLRSDWADEELVLLGGTPAPRSSHYIFENKQFVLLNRAVALARAAFKMPAHREIDIYARGIVPSDRAKILTARIIANADNLSFYFQQNARILARISALPNTTVVMIDEPFLPDPDQAQTYAEIDSRFKQELDLLAASSSLLYWPVIAEADLKPIHFYDPLHLLQGDAQRLCQTILAERLSELSRTMGL